jgi:hypothetical protein
MFGQKGNNKMTNPENEKTIKEFFKKSQAVIKTYSLCDKIPLKKDLDLFIKTNNIKTKHSNDVTYIYIDYIGIAYIIETYGKKGNSTGRKLKINDISFPDYFV